MEDSTREGDSVTDERAMGAQLHNPEFWITNSEEMVTEVPDEPDSEGEVQDPQNSSESETFPRSYVEQLRQENGKYRQRAQRADELAHRLHRVLVEQTGRLQDASDLAFDEDHLADAGKMVAAIDELLAAKPHLAKRTISGEIGQGATPSGSSVDLAALLRGGR